MQFNKSATLSIAFAALLAGTGAAHAQSSTAGATGAADIMAEQDAGAPVGDETLEKFATAFAAVQDIQVQASQALRDVGDRAEAQALQRAAQEQMVEAVRDHGLTVEQYNHVVIRMNEDDALRERVMQNVQGR